MKYSDKIVHNILFLIGASFLYTTLQIVLSVWLSAIITMIVVTIIGVWKERRDKKGGAINENIRDFFPSPLSGMMRTKPAVKKVA